MPTSSVPCKVNVNAVTCGSNVPADESQLPFSADLLQRGLCAHHLGWLFRQSDASSCFSLPFLFCEVSLQLEIAQPFESFTCWLPQSIQSNDWWLVAIAAVLLAGKTENSPRGLKQIIGVASSVKPLNAHAGFAAMLTNAQQFAWLCDLVLKASHMLHTKVDTDWRLLCCLLNSSRYQNTTSVLHYFARQAHLSF